MTVLSDLTIPRVLPDPTSEAHELLVDLWHQQVANIVELSRDALTPGDNDGYRANALLLTNQLLAVARQQLDETEAALARLKDGTYGRCAHCSGPISPERLEILPAARNCVTCQAERSQPR